MSSLNDFRAREEQLRRLDEQLNDKKNQVVRRAEELVRQQSDRLARLQLESAAPPASTYGAGGQVHHPYGESEQGFLEETTGYRGRYEAPPAAAPAAAAAHSHSRPASGTAAVRSGSRARPVSAASQEGRRRMSGIPAPQAGASHAAASVATAAAAPARTASASAARSGLSSASASRPQSRTAPRFSAAPSAAPASAAAAPASSDPYGDDYADDGGGGMGVDDAAGVGDVADNVYDDGDALGFGGDGNTDGGGAVSTAGMGTAATLRFQKARLQALGASVSTLTSTVAARDKELADLKALVKAGNDSREKLLRAKEAAEKQVQALQRQADEAAARGHTNESKAASLERELSQANKRRAEMDAEAKTRDAKLNRALQELERGKEMLARAKSGGGAGGGGGGEDAAKELSSLRAANKKLLQQRSELLAGFKKQSKLVELLRRQKLHVEMAKMLQFTEDEFAKTLEMGEI